MGQEGVLSPAPRGLSLICSGLDYHSLAQGRACLLLIQMLPIARAGPAEKGAESRDSRAEPEPGHTSTPTGLEQDLGFLLAVGVW